MGKLNFKLFKKFAPSKCQWCGNKVYDGSEYHEACDDARHKALGINKV